MKAETYLEQAAQDAWQAGQTIDLGECYYGEPHWEGDFVCTPCSYYYFLAGLSRTQGIKRVLEIGTHMGGSICSIYKGIDHTSQDIKLLTVDITDMSAEQLVIYPQIQKMTGNALNDITLRYILCYFDYRPIDLLYIDATHDYMNTMAMFAIYNSLLKPRFAIFDDIYLHTSMKAFWHDLSNLYPANTLGLENISLEIRDPQVGFGLYSRDLQRENSRIPDMANEIIRKGESFFENQQYDKAIELFQRVIEINPINCQAYNNLGAVYWQLDNVEQSLQNFTTAISIDPFDRTTVLNLSEILKILGQQEKAQRICNRYLEIFPTDTEIEQYAADNL